MFEIINQTLLLNSKHHILQNQLSEIFRTEQLDSIINGNTIKTIFKDIK